MLVHCVNMYINKHSNEFFWMMCFSSEAKISQVMNSWFFQLLENSWRELTVQSLWNKYKLLTYYCWLMRQSALRSFQFNGHSQVIECVNQHCWGLHNIFFLEILNIHCCWEPTRISELKILSWLFLLHVWHL
jgi:hypothetical protein